MKVDTLTGPNLSMQVALLSGLRQVKIEKSRHDFLACYAVGDGSNSSFVFNYADPATFQPIAEREKISVRWNIGTHDWIATTTNKAKDSGGRYHPTVSAYGLTEAEARMRCYVKSYLGEDTKGD